MANRSHWALGALATACDLAIRALPVRAASEIMALLLRALAPFIVKRNTIRKNLRTAFPELDDPAIDALAGRIIGNCGRMIAEIAKIPTFRAGAGGTELRARGALDYPLRQRGRAIFVSAHLGNWELAPIIFEREGLPLTIIYTPLRQPAIDDRLMALRRATGGTYVEKSKALRACAAALKRGQSIALLVDQRVEAGIEVEFFARATRFTHFPARMAVKFDCPIVVVESARRGPGRLDAVFHEPIWPDAEAGEDAERVLTQKMAKVIEGCIRRQPEQWFCNKRRWRKQSAPVGAEQTA